MTYRDHDVARHSLHCGMPHHIIHILIIIHSPIAVVSCIRFENRNSYDGRGGVFENFSLHVSEFISTVQTYNVTIAGTLEDTNKKNENRQGIPNNNAREVIKCFNNNIDYVFRIGRLSL